MFLSLSWVLQINKHKWWTSPCMEKHNAGLTWPGYMFLRLRSALCFDSLSILEYTLPLFWVLSINPLMQPNVFRDPVLCCLFQLLKQWPGNTLLDELAVVPTPCLVSSGASHQVWLLLQKSQCLRIQTSWSASCPTSTTHAGPIRCFLVSDFAGCSQDMTAATPLHRGKLRKWSWVTKCWDPGFDKSISTSQTVTSCQRVSYKYKYKLKYIIIIILKIMKNKS